MVHIFAGYVGLVEFHGEVAGGFVASGAEPLAGIERLQVSYVGRACLLVSREFRGKVHLDVPTVFGQCFLVECGQQGIVFGQEPAEPGVRPLIDIGHMGNYLDDRPFTRRWPEPDLLVA